MNFLHRMTLFSWKYWPFGMIDEYHQQLMKGSTFNFEGNDWGLNFFLDAFHLPCYDQYWMESYYYCQLYPIHWWYYSLHMEHVNWVATMVIKFLAAMLTTTRVGHYHRYRPHYNNYYLLKFCFIWLFHYFSYPFQSPTFWCSTWTWCLPLL